MSEWLPIETAPKDGTEILMFAQWSWGAAVEYEAGLHRTRVAFWDELSGEYDPELGDTTGAFVTATDNPYEDYAVNPTHWKPLDAPPQ